MGGSVLNLSIDVTPDMAVLVAKRPDDGELVRTAEFETSLVVCRVLGPDRQ